MRKSLLGVVCATAFAVWSIAAGASTPAEVAQKEQPKVAAGTIVLKADNGILYSRNELEHLAKGVLAGGRVASVSNCTKKSNADPVAALKNFNDQLKALNIRLLVLPVPPKLAFYPIGGLNPGDAMQYLRPFYAELRQNGIEVIDLGDEFLRAPDKNVFCKTDAHWSPAGIAIAAEETAKRIDIRGNAKFTIATPKVEISGDLARSLDPKNPQRENVALNVVSEPVFDDASPVLVIGDSHTLFLSSGGDMLAKNAGFCETLAVKLGMPVERIGVKGSAATAVRINLYRKAVKNPQWLKNKKFLVYVFSCREFTESPGGWAKIPVKK